MVLHDLHPNLMSVLSSDAEKVDASSSNARFRLAVVAVGDPVGIMEVAEETAELTGVEDRRRKPSWCGRSW